MGIYAHVSKRQTEEPEDRFADFMNIIEDHQPKSGMVKTKKADYLY